MTIPRKLVLRARAVNLLVYAHPKGAGFILHEVLDDQDFEVKIDRADRQLDFLSLVVCLLKRYKMRDAFFVAVLTEAKLIEELRGRLDLLEV